MALSLNQTIAHLKVMMNHLKDVVFPQYSDGQAGYASRSIHSELEAVTDAATASAFMERIPRIRELLETDVDAIAHNDPAVKSLQPADRETLLIAHRVVLRGQNHADAGIFHKF